MSNRIFNYIYEQEIIQIVIFAVGIYHVSQYTVDGVFYFGEKIYSSIHKLF